MLTTAKHAKYYNFLYKVSKPCNEQNGINRFLNYENQFNKMTEIQLALVHLILSQQSIIILIKIKMKHQVHIQQNQS